MGPAAACRNRVHERSDRFRVAVVILERDFHLDVVLLGCEVDHVVHDRFALVEELDELARSAVVFERFGLVRALVFQNNLQPGVQKSDFLKPFGEGIVADRNAVLENAAVRLEGNARTCFVRGPRHL